MNAQPNTPDRLVLKNAAEVERELGRLLKAFQKYPTTIGIEDFLVFEPQAWGAFFRAISKTEGITRYYDQETIAEMVQRAYRTLENPKTPNAFCNAFVSGFETVYKEWVAIFPLGFVNFFTRPYDTLKRSIKFGDQLLSPPLKSEKSFCKFFEKRYGTTKLQTDLIQHQIRQSGDFLYKRPLLTFPMRGTRSRLQNDSQRHFSHFKGLHDLFAVCFAHQIQFTNLAHEEVRHFFLLNIKNGKLHRCPLWVEPHFKASFDPDRFKLYGKKGFLGFLQLLSQHRNMSPLEQRIFSSLHFFAKGFNEADSLSRFLFYIIAAEALFSKSKDNPIRITLADNIALLADSNEDRELVHRTVRELYDLRSKIVHSGHANVPMGIIEKAETIVAVTLFKALHLSLTIKSDDAFFDELLRMKLGISKTSVPVLKMLRSKEPSNFDLDA